MAWSSDVAVALGAVLLASGCSKSLFDAHSDDDHPILDATPDMPDATIPDTCTAPCITDAAAVFDATAHGRDGLWSYVGDRRDHTWQPMTNAGNALIGDASNRIERCTDKPSASACQKLPGALLVTSSGTSSPSDPSLEYAATQPRVIQLTVRAAIPLDSVEHRVRVYRNSREDVLYTASGSPGATVAHTLTVDAIPGDRFLVGLEPTSPQGGTSALHVFINDAVKPFPSSCQLALEFSAPDIVNATVDDLCRGVFTSISNTLPAPPAINPGPFAFHGQGIYLEPGLHLYGSQPLTSGDATVQFWALNDLSGSGKRAVFSDIDENTGRGLLVQFNRSTTFTLEAAVVGTMNPIGYTSQSVDIANADKWHFYRVVHAAGTVTFCVDGTRVLSFPLPISTGTAFPPYIGTNGAWFPANDFLGLLDDIRVFSEPLPCNP